MSDKRVQKGNTYAAMVIPAGSYPGTSGANNTQQNQTNNSTTFRTSLASKKTRIVPEYPNRDIPSPEPVYGRTHLALQTTELKCFLSDKPEEAEVGVATEFYLDRPPVPLF